MLTHAVVLLGTEHLGAWVSELIWSAENMIPNLGDLAVAVTFPTNANMVQDRT